ncbi:MAG: hypothetical protein CM1200mP29_16080 [Verrucomicrobiota bacterium]|nr:MAG: hypothetical protein CM1200mP29_16080 [Verrucomicrobiota bacterium]
MSCSPAQTATRESLLAWFPKNNLSVGGCFSVAEYRAARIRTRMLPVSGRPSPTSMMYFAFGGITTTSGETAGTSGLVWEGVHAYFAPL